MAVLGATHTDYTAGLALQVMKHAEASLSPNHGRAQHRAGNTWHVECEAASNLSSLDLYLFLGVILFS